MAQWLSNSAGLYILQSGFADLADMNAVVMSARSGGSGKWEDDLPRLIAQSRGLGVAAARTNLLWLLNADNPSGEGGTTGNYSGTRCTVANTARVDAAHGVRTFTLTSTEQNDARVQLLTTAVLMAGSQYTLSGKVRAITDNAVGVPVLMQIYDNIDSTLGTAVTMSKEWKFATVTHTLNAGSISSGATFARTSAPYVPVGGQWEFDACMLNANGVPLLFVEKEALATSCTVPTPFTAGESFSFLAVIVSAYPGTSAAQRFIWCADASFPINRISCRFEAAGFPYIFFHVSDGVGGGYYRGIRTSDVGGLPAWQPIVVMGSREAVTGELQLVVNGKLATFTSGSPTVEAVRNNNMAVGKYCLSSADYINGVMDLAFWKRCMGSRELVAMSHRAMDSLGI
jgi:hypothetical protein